MKRPMLVEVGGDDGHNHYIPVQSHEEHLYHSNCWCAPKWEEENRKDWLSGYAEFKIFHHKSDQELAQ